MRFLKIAAPITAAAAIAAMAPLRQTIELDRAIMPADGRSTAIARVRTASLLGIETFDPFGRALAWDLRAAAKLGVSVLRAGNGDLVFRSGTQNGELRLALGETSAKTLRFELKPQDTDDDGFPDAAELLSREDRAAFVTWFTAIAEAQFKQLDDAWPKVHQDCAGLVRFAYKEALRKHDRAWLDKRRYLPRQGAPDVAAFRYPEVPFLGDLIFRSTGGRFDPQKPIAEQFSAAAGARALYDHNTTFISRELEDARAGDLLFFAVPQGTGSRMHTMIALGEPDAPADRVVYHTGLDGELGEVRLVTLEQLLQHPDMSWHPRAHNPRFLGVHRLALLVHESTALGALP